MILAVTVSETSRCLIFPTQHTPARHTEASQCPEQHIPHTSQCGSRTNLHPRYCRNGHLSANFVPFHSIRWSLCRRCFRCCCWLELCRSKLTNVALAAFQNLSGTNVNLPLSSSSRLLWYPLRLWLAMSLSISGATWSLSVPLSQLSLSSMGMLCHRCVSKVHRDI